MRIPRRDGLPASTLTLPTGCAPTLLDALDAQFPRIGRATWAERLANGAVLDAEARPLGPDSACRPGMPIHYYREVPDEPAIPFKATLLYADAHLVVADKPHFLPVLPAGRHLRHTLLTQLAAQLDNPDLVPLHRIDRDTAGLVLLSANPDSRGAYQALFRERRIDKRYEAIAPPLPARAMPFTHCSRLEPGEPFFTMREGNGPANSETRIDVIERGGACWRYRLAPVTGRKHQLRVHMAALGVPILHDPLYAAAPVRADGDFSRPLQLLAAQLAFVDPLSGERRAFASALRLTSPLD
jgi:tRNA pseudouridine32 synthase / 23S rRNA pseudouridine746 synthase